MQGLYLVLITNKQSNILEDLETLRLLSKLVPEFCMSLEEEAVCAHAFDLIFAFDEVISAGHKENITIMQVKQNCEMESHEEKLHKMIIEVRERPHSSKQQTGFRRTDLTLRAGGRPRPARGVCRQSTALQADQLHSTAPQTGAPLLRRRTYALASARCSPVQGLGYRVSECAAASLPVLIRTCVCSRPHVSQSKIKDTKEAMKQKAMEIERSKIESKKMTSMLPSSMTGFGSKGGFGSDAAAAAAAEPVIIRSEPPAPRAPANKGPAKGMQLGKAKKTNNFLESLAKEGEVRHSVFNWTIMSH